MGLRPIVSGQSASMDGTDFVVDDSSKKVCGRSGVFKGQIFFFSFLIVECRQ